MNNTKFRIEKDSMGEVKVPIDAYYGAQTQRAVENFPISGITLKKSLIKALGIIKKSAAKANLELQLIPSDIAQAIINVSEEIIQGKFNNQFPIDIYQTGSGTSSNMNANEVIAARAKELSSLVIHPNDHVNFGQSSNDVFPTALRIAILMEIHEKLLPSMLQLHDSFMKQSKKHLNTLKTGRTHLMDAMPVTFGQIFGGYARQIELSMERIQSCIIHLAKLPQGGTAVGTGINTHEKFGALFAKQVSQATGLKFVEAENHFEAQSCIDAPNEISSMLKTFACSLMKIANDFRWMNSGPNSGLAEISLSPLQPGSSIMPGKVNPVIEESVCMSCAQVIGNDATISIAAQSGNFELNVMFPVVAHNILESIELLANSCKNFSSKSVTTLTVNEKHCLDLVNQNPILVTALNPIIGYDLAAKIAKKSMAEKRPLKEVAKELTNLTTEELDNLLDPLKLTKGGIL